MREPVTRFCLSDFLLSGTEQAAAMREALKPRLAEALEDIAGGEALRKPWNVGKAERVVQVMSLLIAYSNLKIAKIAYSNLKIAPPKGSEEALERREGRARRPGYEP